MSVTLDRRLLNGAWALGVNLSHAAEARLQEGRCAPPARGESWREENALAIRERNAFIENHGGPHAPHRKS